MADSTPHTPGGDQLDRALLAAFIPLLRETVIPSTIIAHLMALLPLDEVDKILADERSSGPAVAMQRLLGVLQECRQPGWFQALLDALENSRYEHIRDIIKGRQSACDMAFFRRLLSVCAPNLQRIVAVDMLPHLCCLTVTSPRMVAWLYNYLQGRRQRVFVNGKVSSWQLLTSGVPQGGVLSPYLFLLYMSSRSTVYNDTLDVGYADDVGLSRSIPCRSCGVDNTMSAEALQLDTDDLSTSMERVQKRAVRIISLGGKRTVPKLPSLKERREAAALKLFTAMIKPEHPLHDLVPPQRSTATGRCLRNDSAFTVPKARTERLKRSFVHCAVLVRNEARNHGNSRAVVTLLDRVTRREPGWFQQFVSGLRQTGFDDIAEQLEDLSSVPEEVYSPEEPFAEVSGVVTGEAALPTGNGGGYQSCPEPGFPEETAPRSPEKSAPEPSSPEESAPEPSSPEDTAPEPSSPEDTAPWKVALSQLGSQLISMSGRMGVTVGQTVLGAELTIHLKGTRGAFSHGLQWRFYGEARDQESGRTFKDAEGYCAQSSAVRMAAMGVLNILMTEGIIESREMKDEDFDNLD
ncbi:Interferon induced with helicase C domain 1 [Branchiostoma belcheri]|nr:Interferon induced with helicase C domain 1 [Branchiostoma belcheri]